MFSKAIKSRISFLIEKEKFRLIYKNHEDNKKKYPEIKTPVTILVTSTIANADKLMHKLKKYLMKLNKWGGWNHAG